MKLLRGMIGTAILLGGAIADCNPLKSKKCDDDPALATSLKEDFASKSKYFDKMNEGDISYTDDGLNLTIAKRFDNPSVKSNFYIMFGKVEVVMKAAKGTGVISSFYLQSDDLDEIDIELFGGDDTQYSSNYFSKGDTSTYDRGGYHNTRSSVSTDYHTYTLDWTRSNLTWAVDGHVDRTLRVGDRRGYPQTPMYIMAGIWAGGDSSNSQGTIEWAGGTTDYSEAPFSMLIKSIVVTDYSTGESYSYSDQSGDWTSIKSKDGRINGRRYEAKQDFKKLTSNDDFSDTSSESSVNDSEASTPTSTLRADGSGMAHPKTTTSAQSPSNETPENDSRSSREFTYPTGSLSTSVLAPLGRFTSNTVFPDYGTLTSLSSASPSQNPSTTQDNQGRKLKPLTAFLLLLLTAIA